MNNFELYINNDDLGVTVLENIFINHYMPTAPGDYVKVYLLGLKYCSNKNLSSISNKIIGKTLGILESDVRKAWEYWEQQGILTCERNGDDNYHIKYLHISSLMLQGNNVHTEEEHSNQKIIEELYKTIEFMYGRPLSYKELQIIASWMNDLLFNPEMITLLVEYCFNLNKKDINYINKVALNWYDKKINTYDEAMENINSFREKRDRYYKIMNYLGFKRSPTKAEIGIMDKWISTYNMSMEIIIEACKKTLAIDKPNFKYIDTILTEWHKKNYTKPEDIEKEELPKKQKSETKPTQYNQNGYDYDLLEKKLEEKMWRENE